MPVFRDAVEGDVAAVVALYADDELGAARESPGLPVEDAYLRGGGLGQDMLRWAVAEARARGCRLVQLTTDASRTDAHRFYERLGFRPSHVGMKLPLDSPPARSGAQMAPR